MGLTDEQCDVHGTPYENDRLRTLQNLCRLQEFILTQHRFNRRITL